MARDLLAFAVAGEGPPLLLLNGGLMSLRAWDPVAERLERRFKVIRCDFRGQLLSPGRPEPSLLNHAQDVVQLLDALDLDRVHVAGTSFGALVGVVLAAEYPDRVRSLAVIAATDRVTSEMRDGALALERAAAIAARGGDRGAVFDLVAIGTFSPAYRHRHAAQLAARREAIGRMPATWFEGLTHLLATLEGLDLRPVLPRLACPTLVLAGGQDLTFPLPHAQALASKVPHARLHVLPHGSHGMVLEEPEAVAETILEFVDAVEGAGATPRG